MGLLKDIACCIMENIINTFIHEAEKAVNTFFDRKFDYFKTKINGKIEESFIIEKNRDEDRYCKIKRYILDSLGGYENIVFAKNYKNGYKFVFFDLNDVKYYHMKNLDFRVFISEKLDSMILIPKEDSEKIDLLNLIDENIKYTARRWNSQLKNGTSNG